MRHNTKIRIDINTAQLLSKIGFTREYMEDWYHHVFTQSWRVSEAAVLSYGDLTDDGFYDLTVEGGGDLPWTDIYTNDWAISDHYPMDGQEYYLSPTIYEVQAFLLHMYHKQITIYSKSQESWQYRITSPGQDLEDGDFGEDFDCPENALKDAINRIIHQILC